MKRSIALLAALLCCSLAYAAQAPDTLARKVVDGFKKRPAIESVEVTAASPRGYNLTVWYKATPTIADAKRDTGALVKSILKELVADGVNPSEDFISVHVHAGEKGRGVTGKAVAADYAQSYYNPVQDQVVFEVAK